MAKVDRECEVLVVGAGFAGLSAARRLLEAGIDVVVVEARDRVGGRVWTVRTQSGALVDHGGQWIGPGQDHLEELARELEVGTFPTFSVGHAVEWRDGSRYTYAGLIPTSDPGGAAEGVEAIFDLDLAAQEVPLDAPWDAPRAIERDLETLGSWLATNVSSPAASNVITTAVKGVFGVEPGEISLLFTLFYLHAGGGLMNLARTTGGAQERRFDGGAQQLALGLARVMGEQGRLILGCPVVEIDHGPSGIVATCLPAVARSNRGIEEGSSVKGLEPGDSWKVMARRVVVAMPPALSARLRWSPPLPAARDQLCQRAPMGSVTKVHAVYESPFWRDEGLNGQVVSDHGALRICFDDSPPDGSRGVLVGFIAGNECRALDLAGPHARRRAVVDDLTRYFGELASDPIEVVEQHWPAEPFTRGAPVTVLSPGALSGFGRALRQPLGPVHWAGTETATRWCGYIDGAIESGERAAREVIEALG